MFSNGKMSSDESTTPEMTLHALERWSRRMFRKWGYVVLALERGDVEKVTHFMQSGKRLLEALNAKTQTVEDTDTRNDLQIMAQNLLTLLRHAKRDATAVDRETQEVPRVFGAYMGEQKYYEQKQREADARRRQQAATTLRK